MNLAHDAAASSALLQLPEPEALLNDPDRLLQARAQVLASGAHLHGPEVAERLRVPEAAIMAARIGQDARRLEPDLPRLLAPIPEWSKCLLAIRNRFGVALALGRYRTPQVQDQQWQVSNDEHAIAIGLNFACEVFWLEERDAMHGRSVSLNVFDADGHALLRVYLLSKEGQAQALPHLQSLLSPDQARTWRAQRTPGCRSSLESGRSNQVPSMPAESSARAARLLRLSLLALPRLPQAQVNLHSASSRIASQVCITQSNETPPSCHATGPALKLHLRPQAALTLAELAQDWGSQWQWLADNGDCIRLAPCPGTSPANIRAWLDAWMAAEDVLL